jgi:hypothetical protein
VTGLRQHIVAWRALVTASGRGDNWRRLWLLPLLALVLGVYALYCSAGTFGHWPEYSRYYDLLAEGFRSGHLYLPVAPAPELLAQADPYDPRHARLWMWDISLYGGKYYAYWGPLPALLQALTKSLLRIEGMIGDQYLVFFFTSLSAVLGALLIDAVARRHFPAVPRWLVGVAIIAFCFANPALYLVASAGVYQAAITSGQAFLLGGVLAAYEALAGPNAVTRRRRLLLAGLAWGCALSCRVSLGPCIALMGAAAVATQMQRDRPWLKSAALDALCLGLPVAACCSGLLAYNYLRFGELLEFGTTHQLSHLKFRVSSIYWGTNLYAYSLTPYELSCRFPYLLQNWYEGPKGLPAWFRTPPQYHVQEPVAGWLLAVPFTWLAPASIVSVVSAWRRRLPEPRAFGFVLAAVVCLGSVTGFAELGLYMATMRYLADVTNGLVLLGVLGAFSLCSLREGLLRRVAGSLVALLGAATLAAGLLLGFQGYTRHFAQKNPALQAQLERSLSFCPAKPPPRPKPAPRPKRAKPKRAQQKATQS